MRILYIVPEEFNGKRWGGVTSYTVEYAARLIQIGHAVTILTPGKQMSQHTYRRITIVRIPPDATRFRERIVLKILQYISQSLYSRIAWSFAVRSYVNNSKFDIVESPEWGSSTLLLRSTPHTNVIVRMHRSWLQYKQDNKLPIVLTDYLINIFECLCILKSSAVTSPTIYMLKQHSLLVYMVQRLGKRVRVIRNAVPPYKSIGGLCTVKGKYILTVGRIEIGKGSVLLAEAFLSIAHRIPRICLVYIGEDTEMYIAGKQQSCESYIRGLFKLHNRVDQLVILPRMKRENLYGYYKKCMVYVAPSRGNENPSMSLLEAISAGACVVASTAGGIPETVATLKNIQLVPEDNVEALSKSILSATAVKKNTKRTLSESISFDSQIEKTERLYLEVHQRALSR